MPNTQTFGATAQTGAQKVAQETQNAAGAAESALSKAKHRVTESIAGATDCCQSALKSAKETAREGISEVEASFHSRPLAFVGGAFCLGLVIGLAIPAMSRERAALAPLSKKLRRKGGELADEIESRAREAAAAAEEKLTAGS